MSAIPSKERLLEMSWVREKAKSIGFFDCGVSKATALPEDEKKVESWLDAGMHAEMFWMEKNKEKRYDPTKLVAGAQSVISCLYPYATNEKLTEENNYKISMYAYGKDYHIVVKDKLYELLHQIENHYGDVKARVFVDSAPVLDRAWANKAGLGFIGKNTMLINRKGGSYFFIGHIVIDLAVEHINNIAEKNFCGSCTLCITACPTNALEPFVLDSRKCISYLTIENKNGIPRQFKNEFNDWIFGCDICQEVCPWNRDTEIHSEEQFRLSEELLNMKKHDWHQLDEEKFNLLFGHSALQRTSFNGLKRNIQYLAE